MERNDAFLFVSREGDEQRLHDSCKRGDLAAVRSLLSEFEVNAVDDKGLTPLYIACAKGFVAIADLLLDAGAVIDLVRNDCRPYVLKDGYKALHAAAVRGELDMVKLLLRRGANVHVLDRVGITPLHLACLEGHWQIASELMDSGIDVNVACGKLADLPIEGYTTLHFAAVSGSEHTVQLLLSRKADVDAQSPLRLSPLMLACYLKHRRIAELLLKSGAGVNVAANYVGAKRGFTPLYFAANGDTLKGGIQNHVELIKVLFSFGADVNAEGDEGKTPLVVVLDWPPAFHREKKAIAEVFAMQHVSMKAHNEFVSGVNLHALSNHDMLREFSRSCQSEIEIMRTMTIGDSQITFFDAFTKGPLRLADYMDNKSVASFTVSEDIDVDFPIYGRQIRNKLRQGEKRRDLLRLSDCVWSLSRLRYFPYEITRKLNRYLSNDDLRKFILAKLDAN